MRILTESLRNKLNNLFEEEQRASKKPLTENVEVITASEFPTLYKGSWYTIEGAGGDLKEWEKGIQDLLTKEGIGEVKRWVTYKGKDMNEWAKLTGTNAYPDNLTFISFSLDGLDGGKLVMFKIRMGDRWFDDIVDNNARREGYHPIKGNYNDEDDLDESVVTEAETEKSSDFKIENGVLVKYKGNDEKVTIPDSVTSIGEAAFHQCYDIMNVTIPNSVKSIGVQAFGDCLNLKSIVIPNSVKSIDSWAFAQCNLKDIYYTGTEEEFKKIGGLRVSDLLSNNPTIHYNSKSINESLTESADKRIEAKKKADDVLSKDKELNSIIYGYSDKMGFHEFRNPVLCKTDRELQAETKAIKNKHSASTVYVAYQK